MQIDKVNKLNFFIIRYLLIISFCFLTLFITGRIADMEVLLGWTEYSATGLSTKIATNTFSLIGNWGNSYILIIFLAILFSFILFYILRDLIDKLNIKIWQSILIAPGILIYTHAPTKETLFLYPSIIIIILECNYISGRKSLDFKNFFLKILLLLFMFIIRGDQAIPYLILSLICIVLKNINSGKTYKKLKIASLCFKVFLISILFNFLLNLFFPETINRLTLYLANSLVVKENIFRPDQFNVNQNIFNIIYLQYLSLFPTLGELLQKPYKSIIVLDSILIIYSFIKSWGNLFTLIDPYKTLKRFVLIIFTYIFIIYLSFYGIFGSINLGASQRFRINYIPMGIFFPLILEKKLRDKERLISYKYQ